MTPLTQQFVDSCPIERGFRMRGLEMTRLEVFIDAAFAFAVTMLVISFDSIPQTYEDLMFAIRNIPAFIIAVAQLVWIWHTHNIWSRRFGLDTTYTVFISTTLLVVMLIYVYPMRIMAAGMFSWLTNDFLPASFMMSSWDELRNMFIFLSMGFIALSLVFVQMYRHAAKLKDELLLSDFELFEARTLVIMWSGVVVIGLLCIILALTLSDELVPFSGFAYSLIAAWFPLVRSNRIKAARELKISPKDLTSN